nr:GAF domain-containing protein [Chloroflexota bacterium]
MPASNQRELERLTRELHALTEVAKTLTTPLGLPALLGAVMSKLTDVLEPAEAGVIMLWDQSAGLFRAEAAFGYHLDTLRELGLRAGESMTGKVFDEGAARLFATPAEVAAAMADMRPANRSAMARTLGLDALPQSALAVPLHVSDRKFGVLVLETLRGSKEFTGSDLPLVQTLADLIALAIDRFRFEDEAEVIRHAEQAESLRSEVMATLSHELRTPLAAIKGYATALLLEEVAWPEEKRGEFLHLIDDECENLQAMIADILDSSLIDAGQLALERQPVRLSRLAREIADDMQRRSETHRLVVDIPPDSPIVDVDPRRITQVFRNILDNAVKYSPKGGLVMIRGEVRPADVVISIADQGVGISPEDLIPLFEKYFRVKAPTGYHVAGTGLGLPVARAIVEAHGGRIWAESKVGQGTTLYFSLPRAGLSAGMEGE